MPRETVPQRRKRIHEILALLKRYYPDAECALHYSNPEELLIATVLSAQCTDERVNKVTPALFAAYPAMKELAAAPVAEIEAHIKSVNFFRNKAKNLQALADILVSRHNGRVPADLEALVKLPGVGRKTANVVLGNAFRRATGIVVDTHVQRLSRRLGLTRADTPVDIERDLMKLVPKGEWIEVSHWLIFHGRQVCKARKPACATCFLADICPQRMG
jgi:endonuclease III